MKAWHFTDGNKLRDGRPLPPIGETLRHDGPLVPCQSGLHASERAFDALRYAPGTVAHRVELGGEMVEHNYDKWCARERTILWSVDATGVLWKFTRLCAQDVVHLWDAPPVVREWLSTGDLAFRAAARAAAVAAETGAGAADWAAARSTRHAASSAAMGAPEAAARTAACAATAAAEATADVRPAWVAARAAAVAAQNARLEAMLIAAHEGQT